MGRTKKPSESSKKDAKTPVVPPVREVLVDHDKPDDVSHALIRRKRKKAPGEPMSDQSLLSMSIARASFHASPSVAGSTRSKKSGFSQSVKSGMRKTFNFSKYKIKINKQPSHDALRKAVDHYYRQMDPKTNTVADMYRAVEDHFVLELTKPNRKFVRQRLIELSVETNVDGKKEGNENSDPVDPSSPKSTQDSPSKVSKRSVSRSKDSDDMLLSPIPEVQFEKSDPDGTIADDEPVAAVEEGRPLMRDSQQQLSQQRKRTTSGMESSVLRFENINFVVGRGDKKKTILKNVSGKVKAGHVLAVLGPSGAGKTTLINALTLDAFYGESFGVVTLNGQDMNDKIFRQHCYVVKQKDSHFAYLTCRETLTYAAKLYDISEDHNISALVDEAISNTGLGTCADTKAWRLSGGEMRRLSIAVALLKQPTCLFLDEPTSGLDAAAAASIIEEIRMLAKREKLIIICTIHQPSTKVYNGFDQVMILSRGREAYTGDVKYAMSYFAKLGHPTPKNMNPAEHFLDLVNADFSDEATVEGILDIWEKKMGPNLSEVRSAPSVDENQAIVPEDRRSLVREVIIMTKRHSLLIARDPILYLGRCIIFLVSNSLFAFVYWNSRPNTQDQATNKFWLCLWFSGVSCNMAVVAVYALNEEFKSLLQETKNGMVRAMTYAIIKSILTLPVMVVFALFAVGIQGYAINTFDPSSLLPVILLTAAILFVYEAIAECMAVWFDNPIIGMLNFMNFWFAGFLFGGFVIPESDLYWPFRAFYYVLPYQYFIHGATYEIFANTEFEPCLDPFTSAICTNSTDGLDVLDQLSKVFPVASSEGRFASDVGVMLAIAGFFKVLFLLGVAIKGNRSSTFKKTS